MFILCQGLFFTSQSGVTKRLTPGFNCGTNMAAHLDVQGGRGDKSIQGGDEEGRVVGTVGWCNSTSVWYRCAACLFVLIYLRAINACGVQYVCQYNDRFPVLFRAIIHTERGTVPSTETLDTKEFVSWLTTVSGMGQRVNIS